MIIIIHGGIWLCFKHNKPIHNYSFTHNDFGFIRNFKEPLLLNRQLYVNMGDRGGLLLLDAIVHT